LVRGAAPVAGGAHSTTWLATGSGGAGSATTCALPGVTRTVTVAPWGAATVSARTGSLGAPAWLVDAQPGSEIRMYALPLAVVGSSTNSSQDTATSNAAPVAAEDSTRTG